MKVKEQNRTVQLKFLLFLLSLLLVWGVFVTTFVTADAAGGDDDRPVVHVTEWKELASAISQSTRDKIIIDNALGDQNNRSSECILEVYGDHILDLNGHDIDVSFGDSVGEELGTHYLFNIRSGASLTINDSSGDNSAMVRIHAYMTTSTMLVSGLNDTWKQQNTGDFNLFYVSKGATLTINGGEYNAGRQKNQYLNKAFDDGFVNGYGGLTNTYYGYAYQVVGGSVFVGASDSTIIINGGEFYGRKDDLFDINETTKVRINNGYFYSIVGGDIFSVNADHGNANIQIASGFFACDYLNRIWYTDTTEKFQTLIWEARSKHGYSGQFKINGNYIPHDENGNFYAGVSYNGKLCRTVDEYNAAYSADSDDRTGRTLQISPTTHTEGTLVGTGADKQVVGAEETIYFEDTDFVLSDSGIKFDSEIQEYGVLADLDEGVQVTATAKYFLKEYQNGVLTGTVTIDKTFDGARTLDIREGFSLSALQAAGKAGLAKWTGGTKKGQNIELQTTGEGTKISYYLRAQYDYKMTNQTITCLWSALSTDAFSFTMVDGFDVEEVAIQIKGAHIKAEPDSENRPFVLTSGYLLSDIEFTTNNQSIKNITVVGIYENGKAITDETAIIYPGSAYSFYVRMDANDKNIFRNDSKIYIDDLINDIYHISFSPDYKTAYLWVRAYSDCNHEYEADANVHHCTICGSVGAHSYGALSRVDSNTQVHTCEICDYQEKIEAEKYGNIKLATPYVFTVGDILPDLSETYEKLIDDGIVDTYLCRWYYAGTEKPDSSKMTKAQMQALPSVAAGAELEEGYYILYCSTTLTDEYRFGSFPNHCITASYTRMSLDGKTRTVSSDYKNLQDALCVHVLPEATFTTTLPELKEGMTMAQYAALVLENMTNDYDGNYILTVNAYSYGLEKQESYGDAIYLSKEKTWTYYNGSTEVEQKDSYVFSAGTTGSKSFEISIAVFPLTAEGGFQDYGINVNAASSNEINKTYEKKEYYGSLNAVYILDNRIRKLNLDATIIKLGDTNGANIDMSASEHVTLSSQNAWQVWSDAEGKYVSAGGTAVCGNKYRKSIVVKADGNYVFDDNILVTVNGANVSVEKSLGNNVQCAYVYNKQLVVYLYADYSHDLEFVKVTKPATCAESGSEQYRCTVCGEEVSSDIPAIGHQLVYISAREANCVEVEIKADVAYCTVCDQYFSRSGSCEVIAESDVYGEVDTYNHYCDSDDYIYQMTETTHQLICPYCNTGNGLGNAEPHVFEAVTDDSGNVVIGSYICSVCEYMYGDDPEENTFAIVTQPVSIKVGQGDKASFLVTATGEGLTYQWQYKNADSSTWSNTKVASANAPKLEFVVGSDSKLDGRQYRCIVTDATGAKLTSEAATLTLNSAVNILEQPADANAKVGEKVVFTVKATGKNLTYQWQYRNNTSAGWSNSGISSAKTASLTFTVSGVTLNGRQYRCIVKDANGASMTSEVVTLHVAAITINKQPENVYAKVGEKASFTVTAVGNNLTYQWQYRNVGTTSWSNSGISAAKTANFTFDVNSEDLNGRQYRCVIRDSAGNLLNSEPATLTVNDIRITQYSKDITVKIGDKAVFSVTAVGNNLNYQWQYRNSAADGWSDSKVSNAKKATFDFDVTDTGISGRQYRCKVYDASGKTVYSPAVTLTVDESSVMKITKQPQDATVKPGEKAAFKIEVSGTGVIYQWQYWANNQWNNSNISAAKTDYMNFLVNTDKSVNGRKYRCEVTDKAGNKLYSNTVIVSVDSGLAITTQPEDVSVEVGQKVSFVVKVAGDGLTYQWQFKKKEDTGWSNSKLTAAKTENMYFVPEDRSADNRQYRCVITDSWGNQVITKVVNLRVTEKASVGPVITQQPKDATVTVGDHVEFIVVAEGEDLTYQWQLLDVGKTDWSSSKVSQAKTPCMEFDVTSTQINGRKYRCIVTDKNGNSVITNEVTLTIKEASEAPGASMGTLQISGQPKDVTAKAGENITFSVTATGEGLTYQWQYRNAGATKWSNSSISAAKTANFKFTVGTDTFFNGRQYRCVVTDAKGNALESTVATLTVN